MRVYSGRGRTGAGAALALTLLLGRVEAEASPLRPDTARIATWTRALRDRQPDGPFVLVYRRGQRQLIFVAAQHENAVDSATFRLINRAFSLWPIRSIIVEGSSSALGRNPAELMAITTRSNPNPALDVDGETGPTVRNAVKVGANIYGGEAEDLTVRRLANEAGIEDVDLLGYYILRVIPQWTRDGSITGSNDPRLADLVRKQSARSAANLKLLSNSLPGLPEFASWYRRTNGKLLSAGVEQEETGPLMDGNWPTNRIGATVSRARDVHLVKQIAQRLNTDRSVLVVFGGSHAMIDKPALDAMLGSPCYTGADMTAATERCAPLRRR